VPTRVKNRCSVRLKFIRVFIDRVIGQMHSIVGKIFVTYLFIILSRKSS